MRKYIFALSISLVLSLVLGGVIVFAANSTAPGEPLDAIDQGVETALSFLRAAVSVDGMPPLSVAPVDEIPTTPDEPGISDPADVPVDPVDDGDDVDDPEDPEEGKVNAFCPCDPENPHPVGEKLTNKFLGEGGDFATKYTEIMTYFCEGRFGFGEIDKGLSIALAAGIDAADVFALRDTGMGWGNIRKEYQLPKFPRDPTNPGLGVGLGNSNAGANGNAFGQANNPGNGNAGGNGNGNAYGHTKNKGNKGKKP